MQILVQGEVNYHISTELNSFQYFATINSEIQQIMEKTDWNRDKLMEQDSTTRQSRMISILYPFVKF